MRLHVSAAVGPSFDHAVGAQQQRGGIARPSAFAALMLPATSTPLEPFSSSTSSNPDNQPDYPSFRLISLLELTTLPVAVTFSSANQVALRLIAQPTPPELHHDPARPLVAGLGNALLGLAVAAAIRRGSEPDATRHLAPIMRVIMKLPAACLTHDRQRPAYSRRASEIPPTHGRDHRCGPNGNVAGRRARTLLGYATEVSCDRCSVVSRVLAKESGRRPTAAMPGSTRQSGIAVSGLVAARSAFPE